ncbi:hypothetical protein JQ580_30000 [Bradyrhizobium japonicum]|uniref:hypothetical protein n=1 Tax=Bradyrhizobium japonicum TaxID=375 RepID=UPI001BA548D9|nr:hypothetical protein [Bradyrhizobium japonicum]MBR0994949.1 hypothetical protein [Bradyrhizobium japonicum]
MIGAKKALITPSVPIRPVPAQLGFEILDDTVKQARGERIRHLPLQTPIPRDLAFLLSHLALCHQMNPPVN